MKRLLFILMLWIGTVFVASAIPPKKVPSQMEFGGIKLKLTESARKEIQHEVDMLTRSEKYYNIKADRIKLYFPIIEEALKEEGVPTDLKYLAVQESALISDAVSSAKAVGFWQFKDFTGREVGLRIDKRVDERLNVVASTHGAAKYFKRHNFYFDNWIYTVLAHMTGKAGANKYVDKSKFGANRMTIDKKTHWYVRRFLAHMIAFDGADQGAHSEGKSLSIHQKSGGQTLTEIAKRNKVEREDIYKYNKWLKSGPVPKDKTYSVIIPGKGKRPNVKKGGGKGKGKSDDVIATVDIDIPGQPASITAGIKSAGTIFIKINGIPSVLAKSGDDLESLAKKSGVPAEKLARYNDISLTENLKEGEIYYLKPKRNKARTYFYTVKRGESVWDVSQRFGIKEKSLRKLNRMEKDEKLQPGRVLWLKKKMSKFEPIEINELPLLPPKEIVKEVKEVFNNDEPDEEEVPTDISPEEEKEAPIEEEEETAIPIAVPSAPKTSVKSAKTHTVAAGETMYGISRQYDLSVAEMMELNALEDHHLSVGQVLIVDGEPVTQKEPKAQQEPVEEASESVSLHVVQPGETMYAISRKYNIAVKDLLELNHKENFDIAVGEKLRVK